MGGEGNGGKRGKPPAHKLLLREIREIVFESPETRAVGPSVRFTKVRFNTLCQILADMRISGKERVEVLKSLKDLYERARWETEVAEAIDADLNRTIEEVEGE